MAPRDIFGTKQRNNHQSKNVVDPVSGSSLTFIRDDNPENRVYYKVYEFSYCISGKTILLEALISRGVIGDYNRHLAKLNIERPSPRDIIIERRYFAYMYGILSYCNRISNTSSVPYEIFWQDWSSDEIFKMGEKLAELYFKLFLLGEDEDGKFVFPDRIQVNLPRLQIVGFSHIPNLKRKS
jgi:hypothetical protein